MTRALPATPDEALDAEAADVVLKDIARFHALALGPGLGRDAATQHAVRRIVAECPLPIVVDADALNALAADPAAFEARHAAGRPLAILTPHAGEFARLAGGPAGTDRVAAARELAARRDAIVLLKGPGTVVAAPAGAAIVNTTDIAALATAGTGDVLTGIIGGLLAHGVDPFDGRGHRRVRARPRRDGGGNRRRARRRRSRRRVAATLDVLRSGRDPWEG